MGRPLRHHAPGIFHFVTSRCFQARFLLRPDEPFNQLLREWLARAERRLPAVRIYGVVAMSNHVHCIVEDTDGALAPWAQYLFGNLAKATNALRGRSGAIWARRYSAEPILDPEALLERLVYLATNPTQANLCTTYAEWPGVLEIAVTPRARVVPASWIDSARFEALEREAQRDGLGPPSREAARVHGQLTVHPLPQLDSSCPALVTGAILAREAELADQRRAAGVGVATAEAVRSQPWHDAPRSPKRSQRPLSHTRSAALYRQYRDSYRALADMFRHAAARWVAGERSVEFPSWCYRPGGGLVREAVPT